MKDQILSYREMCDKISINFIQKGMNYHIISFPTGLERAEGER